MKLKDWTHPNRGFASRGSACVASGCRASDMLSRLHHSPASRTHSGTSDAHPRARACARTSTPRLPGGGVSARQELCGDARPRWHPQGHLGDPAAARVADSPLGGPLPIEPAHAILCILPIGSAHGDHMHAPHFVSTCRGFYKDLLSFIRILERVNTTALPPPSASYYFYHSCVVNWWCRE